VFIYAKIDHNQFQLILGDFTFWINFWLRPGLDYPKHEAIFYFGHSPCLSLNFGLSP